MSFHNSLIENAWSFSRNDGFLIAPIIRFLPRGVIGGYSHPSEQCWDFRDDYLRFQTISGETTTLFDEIKMDGNGLYELSGNSRISPSCRHILKKTSMPSLGNLADADNDKNESFSWLKFIDTPINKLRRNLIILRAGHNSLHTQWSRNIDLDDRNWDLCISWYDKDIPNTVIDCEYFTHQPQERKFSAIYKILNNNNSLWSYDYIWMPDDDLMTSWRDINRFFNIIRRQNFSLAQPSVSSTSFVNHAITASNPDYLFRYSQFVEVMCPAFSKEALSICLPSFQESKYGFGLDHVWPSLLGRQAGRMAIIDNTCVEHTRPIGSNYNINEAVNEGRTIETLYGASVMFHTDGNMSGNIINL